MTDKKSSARTSRDGTEPPLAQAAASRPLDSQDSMNAAGRNAVLMAAATDAIIVIDETSTIIDVNQAAEEMFGFARAEMLGKDLSELQPASLRSRHAAGVDRYRRTGERSVSWKAAAVTAQHRSGREFPVEISFGEFTEHGEQRFLGIIRDTTERARLETELRQAQKVEALGLLAGGIAHDFNNILAAIVGYTDLADSEVEPQHQVREELTHIRGAAARGMAMTGQLLTFSRREPLEPILPDAEATPDSLAPLLERVMSPSVGLPGWAGAVPPDVEVHELYAALVESAEDAIFTKRLDGTIMSWNPGAARLYGYSPVEIVGRSVTVLAPPEHVDEITAILLRIAAGDRIEHFETVRLHQDGSPRHVALTISPIRNGEGMIVAASTVARDISARKSAEEQLLQAQKLESIGRLAGGIAHDFNNMLTAIRGYADMLTDDLSPDRRSESDLAVSARNVAGISYAADRASALTAQLLAFSRQQPVSPRVVELNAGVHSVQPMLRRLIGENLRLAFKLDPTAGNILADPGQLDQILINLVVNARDAMPDGGTISVETGSADFDEPYALEHFDVEPGPYAMVAVSDTGIGMDRETRMHIFEPFFSTKDVGKGTGLGLATTYGIVRQAGGHIWLYSEPGVGSTFKLYFPRVEAAVTVENEARPGPVGRQTGVVMVVEDEPVVRDVTTRLLERAGYKVVVVDDGVEAVSMLEKMTDPIDVLVTDVIMPNMSGISLGDWVLNRYPQIGVVLLSGYTAETLDLDRISARGASFLSKPFSAAHLLQAVEHARATQREYI